MSAARFPGLSSGDGAEWTRDGRPLEWEEEGLLRIRLINTARPISKALSVRILSDQDICLTRPVNGEERSQRSLTRARIVGHHGECRSKDVGHAAKLGFGGRKHAEDVWRVEISGNVLGELRRDLAF